MCGVMSLQGKHTRTHTHTRYEKEDEIYLFEKGGKNNINVLHISYTTTPHIMPCMPVCIKDVPFLQTLFYIPTYTQHTQETRYTLKTIIYTQKHRRASIKV